MKKWHREKPELFNKRVHEQTGLDIIGVMIDRLNRMGNEEQIQRLELESTASGWRAAV